jgi:hypothetical protein
MDNSPTLKLIQQNFIFKDSNFSQGKFKKNYNDNFKLASFTIDYGIKKYSERIDELFKIVTRFLENLKKKGDVQFLPNNEFLLKNQKYFICNFWKFYSRNTKNEISLKDSNFNSRESSKKSIDFEKLFTKRETLLKVQRSKKNISLRFDFEIKIIIYRNGIIRNNHDMEKFFQRFEFLNVFYSERWKIKIYKKNKIPALLKRKKIFLEDPAIVDEIDEKNRVSSISLSNRTGQKNFNYFKDIPIKSKKLEKKVFKKIKTGYNIEEFFKKLSVSMKTKIFLLFIRRKNESQKKSENFLKEFFFWVLRRKCKHFGKIPNLLEQVSFKNNYNKWPLEHEENGSFFKKKKKDKIKSYFSLDLSYSRKVINQNLKELNVKRQQIYFLKKSSKIQRLNWPCLFKIVEYPYIFFRRKKKQILTQRNEKILARFLVCILYISFETNFLPFNCILGKNIKILVH